jgi:hypothetical protein
MSNLDRQTTQIKGDDKQTNTWNQSWTLPTLPLPSPARGSSFHVPSMCACTQWEHHKNYILPRWNLREERSNAKKRKKNKNKGSHMDNSKGTNKAARTTSQDQDHALNTCTHSWMIWSTTLTTHVCAQGVPAQSICTYQLSELQCICIG